jgi:putative inorganic carbon (HCO3(-)) transporter
MTIMPFHTGIKNGIRFILFFSFSLIILAVWPKHLHPYNSIKDAVFIVSTSLCILSLLVRASKSGFIIMSDSRLFFAVMIYFIYILILFFIFPYTNDYSLVLFSFQVSTFIIISNVGNEKFSLHMISTLSVVSLICSLYGIGQFLGYDFDFLPLGIDSTRLHVGTRIHTTLGNPNLVGGFSAFVLPLTISMAISYLRSQNRIFSAFFFLVSGFTTISLVMSQTRGSWIACIISIFFLVLMLKGNCFVWKLKDHKLLITALTILSLVIGSFIFQSEKSFLKPLSDSTTITYRLHWYRQTIIMIKKKPFWGRGLGTFEIYYPLFKNNRKATPLNEPMDEFYRVAHPHNEHLEIISETGFVGYILFCWIIFESLKLLLRRKTIIDIGIAAAIIGLLCDGMFSQNLRYIAISSLLWLALGLSNSNQSNSILKIYIPGKNQYIRIILVIIITVLITIYPLKLTYQKLISENLFYKITTVKPEKTVVLLKKIIQVDPKNKEALFHLGTIFNTMKLDDQAVHYLEHTLQIDPYYRDTNFNLAEVYYRKGEKQKAHLYCEQQIRIDNMHWKAYYNLALLDLKDNRKREAKNYLEEILKINVLKSISHSYVKKV